MVKLLAFLRLARIEHGVIAAFASLVGLAVASGGWWSVRWDKAAVAAAVTVLVEVGLFVFNDVYNLEEDRVNAPDRPLVRGDVELSEAKALGVTSLTAGVLLAAPLGAAPLAITLSAALSGNAYNMRLKKSGFPGNLIVATDTALPFLFGATVAQGLNVPIKALLITAISFLAVLGREVLKGIVDLEGDVRAGVRTLATTKGVEFAARLTSTLLALAIALSSLVVPLVEGVGRLAYVAVVSLVCFLLAYVACSLLVNCSKEVAERGRRATLLAMLLGTVAFALTA